jgi:hypothetical protein
MGIFPSSSRGGEKDGHLPLEKPVGERKRNVRVRWFLGPSALPDLVDFRDDRLEQGFDPEP